MKARLNQVNVLNLTPNGHEGSVWMSGAGLAADSAGNIYPLVANGTFDTTLNQNGFPSQGDYGNAFVKLSTANGGLAVADYFTMSNTVSESNADEDLGSGGALVLPDMTDANGVTRHLAVGAGKDQAIYLVDRDNMGKFNPQADNIYQELLSALPGGIYSMPAYFNGRLYYGPVGNNLLAFQFSNAKLQTPPVSSTSTTFAYPGATPSISANGTSNAIVWATENTNPAVLHAYDATDLSHELYNSNQAGTRDQFGAGNKFITPTIANGKVYVGTTNGVGAFGLLGCRRRLHLGCRFRGIRFGHRDPRADGAILAEHDGLGRVQPVRVIHLQRRARRSKLLGFPLFRHPRRQFRHGADGERLHDSALADTELARAWSRRSSGAEVVVAGGCYAAINPHLRCEAGPLADSRRSGSVCACGHFVGRLRRGRERWSRTPMTNPGTPAGTYTLTVTGSSTSSSTTLTHSVTLQFVVS